MSGRKKDTYFCSGEFSNMHKRLFSKNVTIVNVWILTICVAFAVSQRPEHHHVTDRAESGNYEIVYCNATSSGPHTAFLQTLIPYMLDTLQAVLRDVDRGTASPAYRAFFKTNSSIADVRQVFTQIVNGSAIPDVGVAPEDDGSKWAPTLVCADADQPFLQYYRVLCSVPERPVMNVLQPAKIISICPIFWTLPHVALKAACPRVNIDGKLLTEPFNLRTTQFAVLVHELVHVYNAFDNKQEVYDMEDVVGLSAARSLENAQNYASYAAGEFCVCMNSGSGCEVDGDAMSWMRR